MPTMRGVLTSGVLAVSLCATVASASAFDLYCLGARAEGMGGAMTAEANDHSAVFYNPALLTRSKDANFGFSVQWHRVMSDVVSTDKAKTLDCTNCAPPDAVGTSLGLVLPLGGVVKERVAIGVGLYLPTSKLLRLFAPDATRPYWYLYTANPDRFALNLGIGIKATDWLSFGLGASVLADLIATGASVQVDLFSKRVNFRDIDATLTNRIGPVFGASVTPRKNLRFGVNFRWEMKLIYVIPAKVDLDGVGTLQFVIQGVTHYSPHTLSFGGAWDITDQFTVSIDGEWANWSAAPNPYMDLGIKLNGPTLAALGLDKAFDINSPVQKTGFSDTLSGRIGAEYRINTRVAVRAGFSYRPSPVPQQNVAGTNLLDSTQVGGHLGFGANFDDPLEILKSPLHLELGGQLAFLLPRTTTKEAVDTVPSYTYSARMFGVTGSVRYDF